MKQKQQSTKPADIIAKERPSRKRAFDEATVTKSFVFEGTGESLLAGEFSGSPPVTLVGGLREHQGRPAKRLYQTSSSLHEIQQTLVLVHRLKQKAKQEPLVLVSRAFDIFAEQNKDDSMGIQTNYQHTLRSLLWNWFDKVQDRKGSIDAVLTAMEKHIGSTMVQLEGSLLLHRFFVAHPQVIEDVFGNAPKHTSTPATGSSHRQRAMQSIFQSMQAHIDHVVLLYLGLDLIRKIVDNPVECRLAGGTTMLWQIMQRHPLELPIQQLGLSLLAELAEEDTCRDQLIRAGALEVIPCLMQLHRTNAGIQCNGAAALCWFVHAGDRNGRRELPASHVPTILDILELHQLNASAFGNCVCLLCSVQFQNAADDERVLEIILNGMKTHIQSAHVQECCLRWLWLRDPARISVERLSEYLLPLILEGMKQHAKDSNVQTQAVAVLTLFASQQSLQETLLRAGAVDGVLESFRQNKNERRVQEGAVVFLGLLVPPVEEPYVSAFGGGFGLIDVMWQSMVNSGQTEED